jgi:hypothetical protein
MKKSLTFHLELILKWSEPPVWRKLSVPGRYRLDQLHGMIQVLFGWENCHLHDFQFGDTRYADLDVMDGFDHEDEMVPLAEALGARKSFIYRYDFGDSWEVHVKVLKRIQGDTDAPECLDGALAGPPEDCGGIPGFDRLKEVLENPGADEEDLWLLDLVPKGYRPEAFSLEAVNKKLQRSFGRKRRGPKAPPEAFLAGYRLSKLNLIGAIVAALKERSPLTLEQVESRLTELGFPLPAGRQSLRRSLAKSETVRVRVDGALELVPGEALRHVVFWMDHRNQEGLPQPAPATVEPEPLAGPVSWAEIEAGVPWGPFPTAMSLRRKLILIVDALGGRATLAEALKALQKIEERIQPGLAEQAERTLKGCLALESREGVLEIREGAETDQARAVYRAWTLPHRRRELERARTADGSQHRQDDYRERKVAEFREAQGRSIAVLAARWARDGFAMVLLDPRDRQMRWLTDPTEGLRAVRDYDVLVGLDPRSGFELAGWELTEKVVINLTPTFKSMPMWNGQRKNVSTSEAVSMVTGAALCKGEEVQAWMARQQQDKARAALGKDAENLYRYWRFGVVHGAVLRGDEWMPVAWNEGKDIMLSHALEWCAEDKRPLELTLRDGRSGQFLPQEIEWLIRYGRENAVKGIWVETGQLATLEFPEIADCNYPYRVDPARLVKGIW